MSLQLMIMSAVPQALLCLLRETKPWPVCLWFKLQTLLLTPGAVVLSRVQGPCWQRVLVGQGDVWGFSLHE